MSIYDIPVFLLKLIRLGIWILMIIVALGIIQPYVKGYNSYTYLQPLTKVDKEINSTVKEYIPTTIGNRDWSRILTLVGFLILLAIVGTADNHFRDRRDKRKLTNELEGIKLQTHTAKQQKEISQLQEKIQTTSMRGKSRSALLKEFASIKKELEKTGRNLSFLAIDVVNSTDMKKQEDPVIVERDFNEYHDFVQSKFQKYGYVKASWTPDGVMSCFNTTEQAIEAAQAIIAGLREFNQSVKMMRRDFAVRCGINSGFVYYDVTTPLEEFSDRVIDIAGHMQKHAAPNTILIAKDMVEPVEEHGEFSKTSKIVDSLEAYEWNPESVEPKKDVA